MSVPGPLPPARPLGPMTLLIAAMVFLSVLAAAAGLGLGGVSATLREAVGGRVTVQIVTADPAEAERQAAAVVAALQGLPEASGIRRVPPAEVQALVAPWLGGDDPALPLPALVDVTLSGLDPARLGQRLARVAPAAHVDAHGRWLGPVGRLVSALGGLAAALLLLIGAATAATVVVGARGTLDGNRTTVELLHLLGATDRQVATLFQRRFARDAATGGLVGFAAGIVVVFLIGRLFAGLDAELFASAGPSPALYAALVAVPLAVALIAVVAARRAILGALDRMP